MLEPAVSRLAMSAFNGLPQKSLSDPSVNALLVSSPSWSLSPSVMLDVRVTAVRGLALPAADNQRRLCEQYRTYVVAAQCLVSSLPFLVALMMLCLDALMLWSAVLLQPRE